MEHSRIMDTISKEHRSRNMSRIKGRDTKPELVVRSLLHGMGCRFSRDMMVDRKFYYSIIRTI